MQVAHESYVIDMLNSDALEQLILAKNPTYIVPEIEAINTDSLVKLEAHNFNIIPCAKSHETNYGSPGYKSFSCTTA